MRKIITAMFVFVLVASFAKYNKNDFSKIKEEQVSCAILKDYENIKDVYLKAQWLKDNHNKLCPGEDIYSAVYKSHKIDKDNYNTRAKNRPITTFSWTKKINPLISGYNDYDKYITFDIDSANKITDIRLIDNYQYSPSCYSIACFRSIIKHINSSVFKIDDIYFNFVVDANNEVAFEIIDNKIPSAPISISQHNISNEPYYVKPSIFKDNPNLKEKFNIKKIPNKKLIKIKKGLNSPL